MSESKFLPFQDTDGDLHNDKCKFDEIVLESKTCPDCIPNESALVPDWKTSTEPYLNEKNCKYQIKYKTSETTTGYNASDTEEDNENSLLEIYEKYEQDAIIELLEFYNKEITTGATSLIKESIEYTDYDLPARRSSKLVLLYSVPYEVLNAVENAEEDEDEGTENADIEVTYQAVDLAEKLMRVRKGLKLYNRYYKIFNVTAEATQRFKYISTGKQFYLDAYGDFGTGINKGGKKARLELCYKQLVKFFRQQDLSLRPGVGLIRNFGVKEPISEVTLFFDYKYNIKKISCKTEQCGSKEIIFVNKLSKLKKESMWKDDNQSAQTARAYLAQLDSMDTDLQARTPKPWADFITEYTYPTVELLGVNQGLVGEQTGAGCVAEAIGNQVFDGSLFDQEFGISDALAAKWYEVYCNDSTEELNNLKISLGLSINSGVTVSVNDTIPVDSKFPDLWTAAQSQAYDVLQTQNDPFSLLCLAAGDLDFDYPGLLVQLKKCGLEAALTQAITCLFGGLTLEQALSKVAESALKGMNIQNLNDLFIGLPAEQREELDALAKKKLEKGDLFVDDTTNQDVSDAISDNNFMTLTELAGRISDGSYFGMKDEQGNREDRVNGWFESGATTKEADPNAQKRTLAQKFENPAEGANQNSIMSAYVGALLEYYANNFLDLVDRLNRFPGARLITNAILMVDCPRPPFFNPGVFDFIKDLELPFCRNIGDITLPKLVNPFGWYPEIKDILKALFEALKRVILELVVSILIKLFVKICNIIGSAICATLEAAGDIAVSIATGDGTWQKFQAIIRDALCGEGSDQQQINDTIVEMFANFGTGAEAFADQEQTLALAEGISNVMTQRELASAFLGDMSGEASAIVQEVIESEFPQYLNALGNREDISQMFNTMGRILPLDFKDSLRDIVDGIPEDDQTPANSTLCATEEQLEEFCQVRAEILAGRASSEQISKLCEAQVNPEDLGDLQSVLDAGIEDYITSNMPPITSDPGCDNGILPYEPEETIIATTAGLGNDLEMLMVDYSTDMIGNGPTEKNWGLVNMMLSDTEGYPLTTHIRKAGINPFYVDTYGTFMPDPKVIAAAGLVNPLAAIALNALDQSNRQGSYPEKVAVFLQSYMNGEIEEGFVDIDYNNNIQDEEIRSIAAGTTATRPIISDTAYNTTIEYTYSSEDGKVESLEITSGTRKSTEDIKLSFSDYANGLKQYDESEYEYGFDILTYVGEITKTNADINANIYSDNMRIQIVERDNLAAFGLYGSLSSEQSFDTGDWDPDSGDAIDDLTVGDPESESNSDININTTIKYQFLSIDDTFTELQEELEQYTSFQECFIKAKDNQPQSVLLKEIIDNQNGESIDIEKVEAYRENTSKTIIDEIFKVIADVESEITAWDYGAEAETLTTEDTDYGVNDNGTWILYKDTGLTDEDMVLGISYDQYKNEIAGTLDKTRVFYLDPAEFGGTYKKPGIYIKPADFKGWYGLVDVLFPEYSPCKPQSTNLVDFDSIKAKIDELYPSIPEDERLKSDPDCIVEVPYNRVLERPAKAAMIGLIIAACRIYASAHIIKALPMFAQFSPRFPEVFSSAYASYIIEDMQDSFKNARGADWELFNSFSDEDFWYGFLEQCVQMYSYRVDIGEIEPPEEVLNALMRLNSLQEAYDYPESRKDVRGSILPLQSLKDYRLQKNLEAVKETQDDAKIVMKEWIVEQLNYMSQKLISNLENVGFAPEIKDIDFYMLENFTAGSQLTINDTMDSFGTVTATYADLPTIPYDDNDEATEVVDGMPSYYTFGGEFVVKESAGTAASLEVGQEYIGPYHVHINEMGDVVYMIGEEHLDTSHNTLSPMSNTITVVIGDVSDIDTAIYDGDKPFLLEKYISINGDRMSTTAAASEIGSKADLSQLISDVYPGSMELIYSRSPGASMSESQETPIGIK